MRHTEEREYHERDDADGDLGRVADALRRHRAPHGKYGTVNHQQQTQETQVQLLQRVSSLLRAFAHRSYIPRGHFVFLLAAQIKMAVQLCKHDTHAAAAAAAAQKCCYKIQLQFETLTMDGDSVFARPSIYTYSHLLDLRHVAQFSQEQDTFTILYSAPQRENKYRPCKLGLAQYLFETCDKLLQKSRRDEVLEDKDIDNNQ